MSLAIAASLQPSDPIAPVEITHAGDDQALQTLSNRQSADDRAVLDTLFSDQESSARAVEAVDNIAGSIVVVHRLASEGEPAAIGSGVFVGGDGYILASLGTTGTDNEIEVSWSTGESRTARIVRIDRTYQVVLLQVEDPPGSPAPLAGYASRPGDRVFAIGSPLEDFTHTVTGGIVSAISVTMPAIGDNSEIQGVIQHDAALNRGNEGGPIVDLNGNVVGINAGSIVWLDEDVIQGWSFAVPVSALQPLLEDLD
jgi:serine protease Do